MGFVASVCHPSTFRMLIWPEASSAQNNIAAVSAEGSTVCVLILRLNSSCSRSIAFVVRALRHWLGGRRGKANKRSPASSMLSATARCLKDALARHGKPEIFNTDQGSQFTGSAFTGELANNGIAISMDGKGA